MASDLHQVVQGDLGSYRGTSGRPWELQEDLWATSEVSGTPLIPCQLNVRQFSLGRVLDCFKPNTQAFGLPLQPQQHSQPQPRGFCPEKFH